MQLPIEITFRGMSPSQSVEEAIQRWFARLEQSYDRIERCSVVIEMPHHHHLRGNVFHVRIAISVPGLEIAVSHDPAHDLGHEDVYVAISNAFRAARRQLQQHAELRRHDVKRHSA